MDIDHLRGWIGRTEEASDLVTPRLIESYAATFAPHLAPARRATRRSRCTGVSHHPSRR